MRMFLIIVTSFFFLGFSNGFNNKPLQRTKRKLEIGVYYFDGWSGLTKGHINSMLLDQFADREPIWGWITSTQNAMDDQITLASSAGISFFNFCWYYPINEDYEKCPLNRSLTFFLNSPKNSLMKYSIMVANHKGFIIGPKEWDKVCDIWLSLFKEREYLRIDGKPIITFFSIATLLQEFKSPIALNRAFLTLRRKCKDAGIGDITIAACISGSMNLIEVVRNCGIDVVTGYCYQGKALNSKRPLPIDSLLKDNISIWNKFKEASPPYVPAITLNWDPRPWSLENEFYKNSSYYFGYSRNSIYKSMTNLFSWIKSNPSKYFNTDVVLIYAWNEYGEGAWLTPGKNDRSSFVSGIKQAKDNYLMQK